MATNYVKTIQEFHKDVEFVNNGSETDYSAIEWIDPAIDQATLDGEWLDYLKARRYEEVDKRTQELISEGFVYDSVTFSLSSMAQTNWIGMKQAADLSLLTYPFAVSTKDDGEYELDDLADLDAFYQTALGVKITHLGSGRALKVSIKDAVDEAALDAIVDNR